MRLRLTIENLKDATGIEKRSMWATLETEIPGMERIDAVSELDKECVLGKEIDQMILDMTVMKQGEMRARGDEIIKNKKKKYVEKNVSK